MSMQGERVHAVMNIYMLFFLGEGSPTWYLLGLKDPSLYNNNSSSSDSAETWLRDLHPLQVYNEVRDRAAQQRDCHGFSGRNS